MEERDRLSLGLFPNRVDHPAHLLREATFDDAWNLSLVFAALEIRQGAIVVLGQVPDQGQCEGGDLFRVAMVVLESMTSGEFDPHLGPAEPPRVDPLDGVEDEGRGVAAGE